MQPSARDIYQDHLDEGSRLLWERQFDALAEIMLYPHRMQLLDGGITLETPAELIEAARDFRDFLHDMGAQAYLRLCRRAEFDDAARRAITGLHETYALRGGAYVVQPYLSEVQLKWSDGTWKNTGVVSQTRNVDCTVLSPRQLRARAAGFRSARAAPDHEKRDRGGDR